MRLLAIILVVIIASGCIQEEIKEEESLLVYSSNCMKRPMTEIGQIFEQRQGIKVEYVFGGSGPIWRKIGEWERGDVFISGSESYAEMAKEKGYFETYSLVAYHTQVIIVPKDNPANINSLHDLTNDSVRMGIGDHRVTAMGKQALKIFENANMTEEIHDNYVVLLESDCADIVPTLLKGKTDAAINCIPSTRGFEDRVAIIGIPEDVNEIKRIPIGVLTFSEDKDNANRFVSLVVSDEGKAVFEKYGFEPIRSG